MKNKIFRSMTLIAIVAIIVGVGKIDGSETATFKELLLWFSVSMAGALWLAIIAFMQS